MTNEQHDALVTSMTREIYNGYAKRVHGDAFVPYDLLLGSMQMVWQEIAQAAVAVCVEACAKVAYDLAEKAAARRMDCTHNGDRLMLRHRSDAYARAAEEIRRLKEPHGRGGGGE